MIKELFNRYPKLTDKFKRAGGALMGDATLTSELSAIVIRSSGRVENKGVICKHKVITDVAVNAIVDAFQTTGSCLLGLYTYHGSGTSTGAEAAGDTTLGAEIATRSTGTRTEGATANIYSTVSTKTYSSSASVTEHGLFNATSGGTLFDRSIFSAINVNIGDSIEFTYQATFNSGG